MKSFFKWIIFSLAFIVAIAFAILKYGSKDYKLKLNSEDLCWKLAYKGMEGAKDFTFDDKFNFFIAFSDRIQYIDTLGKSHILFKDKGLDINSIAYKDHKLYYASKNSIYAYDIDNDKNYEIISNLPNLGDYKECNILIKDNFLYITIGAATNSGVVGEDNTWIKKNPFICDMTPKAITLKGINFNNATTGAFVPYNTKNISGQVVSPHFPGNASIIKYNLEKGSIELFAWGIRNIKGIDFDDGGKIFASLGGMEDRGLRPVKGDCDYIYEIKNGTWYGWPDYSGGDPLDSPRFKGKDNGRIPLLLDKHPSNPPAPIYQNKAVNTLGALAIDKKGVLGNNNDIYFYDKSKNFISLLNKAGVLKDKVHFNENTLITSIKFSNSSLFILDENKGYIYEIYRKDVEDKIVFTKGAMYCALLIITMSIFAILYKNKNL